ncbi:MAG: cell envelope integrity protein CreD [Fulvivirga sp.]|nr:cell envelope integrity protein CreD [Fulvivirga sp.]
METNENKTILTKIQEGLKQSVTLKIVTITIIVLLLLIPHAMVESLIEERESYRNAANTEVKEKWGSEQVLTGPFITIPYKKVFKSKEGEITYTTQYAHFLPQKLDISGQIEPEIRSRGIYEVVLYNGKLGVKGHFEKPDFAAWGIDPSLIQWEDALLSMGISDLAGIQKKITIQWNGLPREISPGLLNHEVATAGVHTAVSFSEAETYPFSFQLDINGSDGLLATPVGKITTVNIASSWPDPSFDGRFIPDQHNISDDGFTASWKVFDLNRNYPQQWQGDSQSLAASAFGLNFLLPVDEYQKNMRSAKYAVLIIALTFLMFFLVEILNKKRFHPIQYALVGLTITVFYVLLLSFTEHLGFNTAYFLASVLTIGLIVIYVRAVFSSKRLTIMAGTSLIVIYFFIYVILQLQDYSLLVGSVGLFIALGILMLLSRKIDWYTMSRSTKKLQPDTSA